MTKISNQYSLTNVLFADTTNGRVGIGTTSPAGKLQVSGGDRGSGIRVESSTNASVALYNSTSAREYQVFSQANGDYSIYDETAGAYRFKITSTGNVGIGTTSPNIYNLLTVLMPNNTNQTGIAIKALNDGGTASQPAVNFLNGSGNLIATIYGDNGTGYLAFNVGSSGTERMRITSGGDTLFQFSSNKRIGIDYDYTGTYFYGFATNSNARQTRIICAAPDANAGISFETGASFSTASQKMLITSGGNVLIGTTSVAERLTVGGGIITFGTSAIVYIGARDGSVNYAWYAENASFLYFYNSGTASVTAQIARTTGVYTALSDVNKKKDFEESNIGLSEVLQLKPTLYRMKTDDESSSKDLGFIAQEVKELIPQAYSESGEGENKFIGLNQMPLIAALTKAIQQQQTQINELKALINA